MKKVILLFFIFAFLYNVSAQATISGIPNINLGFEDFESFSIDTYATGGHLNGSNTISFSNPDNGQGITLYGDTGGQHTNSKFSISLNTIGLIQIISYDENMNSRPITVCVGAVLYQTQACDTFLLEIEEGGGSSPQQIASFSNYNLTSLGGSITLNLGNFFTPFTTFSLGYSDPITSQSVFLTRGSGQGSTSYTGGISTIVDFSNGIATIRFQSNSNSFNQIMNLSVSNSFGQTSATFNVSSTTTAISIIPEQIANFNNESFVSVGTTTTFKISDFFRSYSKIESSIYIQNKFIDRIEICANGNGLTTQHYPQFEWSGAKTIISLRSNNTGDYYNVISDNETNIILDTEVSNQNGACSYSGTTNLLETGNYTIHFVTSIPSNATGTNSIGAIRNWLTNLYPDSKNLTIVERWSYVAVTFILPFVLIALMILMSNNKVPTKLLLYGVFIVDTVLFMFMIAIGYISVTILVVLALVIALYLYIRRGA